MGPGLKSKAPGAVRIEAGSLKGRSIAVPRSARPTEARVRGALFSIWSEQLPNARFLDLYAGSGAVGLEALSRGALVAVFVESDRRAVELLRRNLSLVSRAAARVLARDVDEAVADLIDRGESFDLIFVDPPYEHRIAEWLFAALAELAAPDAELVVEHSRRSPLAEEVSGWYRRGLRRYGETALSIYGRVTS